MYPFWKVLDCPYDDDGALMTVATTTMRRLIVLVLLQAPLASSWQISRRDIFRYGGACAFATCVVIGPPNWEARAVRGAAELDLEYYMRDLLGGNKQEGNILPSAPPKVEPPRTLKGPLLGALMTDDFSPTAIPVAVLAQTIQQARGAGSSQTDTVREIQQLASLIRDKASRSFYVRSPWQTPTVADQYYMDVSAYALWRTAADLLPNYVARDNFVRNVGRAFYRQMVTDGLIDEKLISSASRQPYSVVATMPAVQQLLDGFCASNYCKEYVLGSDMPIAATRTTSPTQKKKKDAAPAPTIVVDELDDEALTSGGIVDFVVRILDPATLGAALQITGEQSRFAPDLVGPTLAALWEDTAKLSATWETFFVDPVYRPNPKDYFPTEQLIQFTLRAS